MRQPIRQALIAGVPQVSSRVYMRGAADLTTPKPFLLLVVGERVPGGAWAGKSALVEVWIFANSLTEADTIQQSVVASLDRKVLSEVGASTPSQRYFLVHESGGTGDFMDPEWNNSLVRALAFRAFTLGWFNGLTYAPDPVTALRTITENILPETQSDPNTWNPSSGSPAIYWRLDRILETERLNWGTWITAIIRGHVIAPDPSIEDIYERRIAEKLSNYNRRRMRLSDGSDMEVLGNISIDPAMDSMSDGQVAITVRWGVLDEDFETEYTGSVINSATLVPVNYPTMYARNISSRASLA